MFGTSTGFGSTSAPSASGATTTFGAQPALFLQSNSISANPATSTLPSAPSLGLGAPTATGSLFGQAPSSSFVPKNTFFSTSVPAQTSTGMPYPKETKFADLPTDVQTAIQSLESTIRSYETASFQVSNRRYEVVESCTNMIGELEGKLQIFEFAISQNQNRMIASKRNLGKYWKYGESVARHISSTKSTTTNAVQGSTITSPEQFKNVLPPLDLKFLDTIIVDFQGRANELEVVAKDIKSLLEHLQLQPSFSIQTLIGTIKAHTETLFALAEKLTSFHNDVQSLRDIYKRYSLVCRNDSRDPFAPKYVQPLGGEQLPSPATQSVVAPKLNSILGQSTPTPSPFGGQSTFGLPSSSSFLKK